MYVCAQLDGVSLIVSTCRKHEKQESLVEQALTALAQLLSAPRSQVRSGQVAPWNLHYPIFRMAHCTGPSLQES